MKSKISFSNLLKKDIKRRFWVLAILLLTYIVMGPVLLLITAENISTYSYGVDFINSMVNSFKPEVLVLIPTLFMASLLTGLSGFSFLFSKKKTDLYHGLPVKRETLFFVNYISGMIMFLIAVLVKYFANILVALSGGYLKRESFYYASCVLFGEIILFFFAYSVVVLAAMLTGTLVTAVIGDIVLISIYPLYSLLFDYLEGYSYVTKYNSSRLCEKIPFFSPFGTAAEFVTRFFDGSIRKFKGASDVAIYLLATFVVGALVFFGAFYLYKLRKSEAAGKAIAFEISKPVIRIPLVILGGLIGTSIACIITSKHFSSWVIISLVFGVLITHVVSQIVFEGDFKAALEKPVQLGICMAATLMIVGVIALDLTGYDKYIPKKDKIASATIALRGIDTDISCINVTEIDKEGRVITEYLDTDSSLLNHMFTSPEMIDSIYEMNKVGISFVDNMKKNRNDNSEIGYAKAYDTVIVGEDSELLDTILESDVEIRDNQNDYRSEFEFTVFYKMKNGKDVARSYRVNKDDILELVGKIYNNKEYKYAHFDVFDAYEKGAINNVDVLDPFSETQMSVMGNEVSGFMDIYLSELENMTFSDLKEVPIGMVSMKMKTPYNYFETFNGYYIYPSFNKTLAYMKEHGVNVDKLTTNIDFNEVESISVSTYDYVYNKNTDETIYVNGIYYTKDDEEGLEKIKEICDKSKLYCYSWSNDTLYDREDRVEFYISYKFNGGIQRSASAYMKKDDIPKDILDDIIKYAAKHPNGY